MNVFETLQEQVNLAEIVERYSKITKNKARCVAPDHPDNDPSMHIYDDHVHCFACSFHGDVTDVWAATRGFDRSIEAALDLAREFGIELPEQDPKAQRKTEERREKEDGFLKQAQECYGALSDHVHAVEWWKRRGFD